MQIKSNIETKTLPVMESFTSIQGEGFHSGKAAHFIRLAGCDVGCVWCDVKESWSIENHQYKKVDDIVLNARKSKTKFVVITGGEPLMYNLTELTQKLKQYGFYIAIETSGAYLLSGTIDWICVSPKKFKAPLKEVLSLADELKVVVYNKSDFAWAEEHAAFVSKKCKLFLQAEYGRRKETVKLILDYLNNYPTWSLSIQIHKILGLP